MLLLLLTKSAPALLNKRWNARLHPISLADMSQSLIL